MKATSKWFKKQIKLSNLNIIYIHYVDNQQLVKGQVESKVAEVPP